MNAEIMSATKLLKSEGYAVIPREKILRLSAQSIVSNRDLFEFGNKKDFLRHVLRDAFISMAMEMQNSKVCAVRSETVRFDTTSYIVTAQFIPHEIETDPVLEMMRETKP